MVPSVIRWNFNSLLLLYASGIESQRNEMRPKDTQSNHPVLHFIMTFEIASALLNRAADGNELLQILESFIDEQQEAEQPIQF